jgi:hypothetical protein
VTGVQLGPLRPPLPDAETLFASRPVEIELLAEGYRRGVKNFSEISGETEDRIRHSLAPSAPTVRRYRDDHRIDGYCPAQTSEACRSLGGCDRFASVEKPVKAESEKDARTLLLAEYDDRGPVSAGDAEKIPQIHSLWTGEKKRKSKKCQRWRCEARHRNLMWHIDLHLFHKENLVKATDRRPIQQMRGLQVSSGQVCDWHCLCPS